MLPNRPNPWSHKHADPDHSQLVTVDRGVVPARGPPSRRSGRAVRASGHAAGRLRSLLQHLVDGEAAHRREHHALDRSAPPARQPDPHRWRDVSPDGPRARGRAAVGTGVAPGLAHSLHLYVPRGRGRGCAHVHDPGVALRYRPPVAADHLHRSRDPGYRWPTPCRGVVSRCLRRGGRESAGPGGGRGSHRGRRLGCGADRFCRPERARPRGRRRSDRLGLLLSRSGTSRRCRTAAGGRARPPRGLCQRSGVKGRAADARAGRRARGERRLRSRRCR